MSLLKKIYITKILNRDDSLFLAGSAMIDNLLDQFWAAFSIFVEMDDNREFFSILKDNWIDSFKRLWKKSDVEKLASLSIEDLLRLRGVLKHITYYNKRYLIPS